MKIDLRKQPEKDIFRNKKKYILWFCFFLWLACVAVAIGLYAIYLTVHPSASLENWALGILVLSSMGVTRFGNRLQEYKALFPPQKEKLALLRTQHSVIEEYCSGVEALQRRFIRAEFEACVDYAEQHQTLEAQAESTTPPVYGPVESPKKRS